MPCMTQLKRVRTTGQNKTEVSVSPWKSSKGFSLDGDKAGTTGFPMEFISELEVKL